MAETVEVDVKPKSGLMIAIIASAIFGFLSGGLGFGTMALLTKSSGDEASEETEAAPEFSFVPFGSLVVNLNDGQMSRYLRVSITLQMDIEKKDEAKLIELVETRKPILTSWLLMYLADMSMEDIRGGVGQNRLRREIQNHFNSVLFPDGTDEIYNLLFEEFAVQ